MITIDLLRICLPSAHCEQPFVSQISLIKAYLYYLYNTTGHLSAGKISCSFFVQIIVNKVYFKHIIVTIIIYTILSVALP
jgi:hypothetical protein